MLGRFIFLRVSGHIVKGVILLRGLRAAVLANTSIVAQDRMKWTLMNSVPDRLEVANGAPFAQCRRLSGGELFTHILDNVGDEYTVTVFDVILVGRDMSSPGTIFEALKGCQVRDHSPNSFPALQFDAFLAMHLLHDLDRLHEHHETLSSCNPGL